MNVVQRDLLRLDGQLRFALHNASRAMSQAYRPMLTELGLTYPQYLALLVLWEQDGVSVKGLGDRLALDSGTLTPLLKRLEIAGLVTRVRAPEDERVVRLFLTPAGRELRARAEAIPPRLLACTGLSETELGSLRDAVRALTDHVRHAPPAVLAAAPKAPPPARRQPLSSPSPAPSSPRTPLPKRKQKTP